MDLTGRHTPTDRFGYGLVMVCFQIRLAKIAQVKTRDIKAIEMPINTLVTKCEPPKAIYLDKESSIVQLAKRTTEQLRWNLYQKHNTKFYFYPSTSKKMV